MIVLTVKTLDSQNHTFQVDDDITVEQFKAKIADTVNISADTQRIIYCGRVLQDSAKLNDYDVNGKVVHLVQRAPPSQNPPTTRSASPQPPRRGFRGFEAGNTMYLGSMAFPSNIMESQGIVPPPPTHSLAGSRLNVARRMLRRAEAVISLLENPSARPADQPSAEEQQEEEITPIIEARVIVPQGNGENIDEEMVLSAVQNTLLLNPGRNSTANDAAAAGAAPAAAASSSDTQPAEASTSSSPEDTPPTTATPADAPSEPGNFRNLVENASRTSEMAELLTTLTQLQVRFAPYLERFREFMAEDPTVPQENLRQTQAVLSRVSEVLHFLGHAYHSLSDIIIRARIPPPRPLLCRPILIQHSAVVQAGIPIQVEVAQFNLSADRPNTNSTSTESTPTTTSATTASEGSAPPPAQGPPTVNLRGFPFLPGAQMRVQSFPIELRTAARSVNLSSTPRNQNNNNNTVGGNDANNATGTTTTTTTTTSSGGGPTGIEGGFNNSSVEFFMEVTPEVLQGNLNAPPPELLQSLVQMAGQIMNRVTTSTPSTEGSSTSSSTTESTQSGATASVPGQNSQARGNTQTNPTTATQTRSTARPHVHLAQQAMQGGFDPFLPCNSHHVTPRRRVQGNATRQPHNNAQQQRQERPQQQVAPQPQSTHPTPQETPPAQQEGTEQEIRQRRQAELERQATQSFQELFSDIYTDLRENLRRRRLVEEMSPEEYSQYLERDRREQEELARNRDAGQPRQPVSAFSRTNRGNAEPVPQIPVPFAFTNFFREAIENLPQLLNGPTIADILNQLPTSEAELRPGESVITDLIMLLARNLTIVDMVTLNTGDLTPLNRAINDLKSFMQQNVLDNQPISPQSVDSGVEKFIADLQPFFQNFGQLRVRDNIDMVRSVELLFKRRLSDIITTAASVSEETMRDLVNKCVALGKMVCAFALYASANGQQGVQDTFGQIVNSYMQGIPSELRNWTSTSSRMNLLSFIANLNIPDSEVEQYIVRNPDVPMTSPEQNQVGNGQPFEEPMELDETPSDSSLPPLSMGGDANEPLPNVVLGSQSWHGQVPEDWVPIITRDVQRQRKQNSQPPFSDAYLSGMPTKRRKIVNSVKPQGSLPQVISDSMRSAIIGSGFASAAPVEVVSQAAGESADVQSAFRSLLRTSVQTALRDNEDFTPERFPNATTYFKTQ